MSDDVAFGDEDFGDAVEVSPPVASEPTPTPTQAIIGKRKASITKRNSRGGATKTIVVRGRKHVVPAEEKQKKKRRFRPGTVALRDIRKYQKGTDFLIKKAPMLRLVREIMDNYASGMRIKKDAFDALRTGTESFAVDILSKAVDLTVHARRVGTTARDLRLAVFNLNAPISLEYASALAREEEKKRQQKQ